MEIIAAPIRQLKTSSMLLLMADGVFNLASVAINTLSEAQIISHNAYVIINTVFIFLIGLARFYRQNIAVTTQEKNDLVSAAAAQPMQDGHANVEVKINDFIVPSTPGAKP